MPLNLDRDDRCLLVVLAAVAAVLFIGGVLILPPPEAPLLYPSSESPASGGALAAYELLRSSGYRIERWRLPPENLPSGANTVLILAEPTRVPTPLSPELDPDRAALRKFLATGGTILATGPTALALLPGADCAAAVPSAVPRPFGPLLVGGPAAGGGVALKPECYWSVDDSQTVPLYGDRQHAVAVLQLGYPGPVELWSSATPLTNSGVSQAGNLALLLNAVGPTPRRILWDEYFHGQIPNWAGYLGVGVLPWILLPVGLLALTGIWTFSRRLVPPAQPASSARESPFEFTAGIGSLYERARDPGLALEIIRQACFRRLGALPPAVEGLTVSGERDEAAALAEYRRLALALAETVAEDPSI